MTRMEVRDLVPEEYEQWRALVEASPTGSPYADPTYLECLCRATGGRYSIRAAFQGEEIVGGVPLYREGRGARSWSLPRLLLYYNGPVLRDYDTRHPADVISRHLSVLEALESSLRHSGIGRIMLRSRSPLRDVRAFQDAGWTAWPGYTLVVPLTDLEGLWKRMDGNARRLVRRAREEELTVTEGGDFEAYFRMHQELHQRKGAPLYLPEGPFRQYVTELRAFGLARLYHARLPTGQSAAVQLVLTGGHPVTHTVTAASAEAHHHTGASPFLRWEAFEDLAKDGFQANDLTHADTGPVTRFKMQLGGDLESYQVVSWSRRGYRIAQLPRRFAQLTRAGLRKLSRLAIRRRVSE